MKYRHSFFLFYLISANLFGQQGYYSNDSLKIMGVKLVNAGPVKNALYGQMIQNGIEVKLMPDKISEYGFKKGKIYKSFLIDSHGPPTYYFLERIAGTQVKFYFLKRAKEGSYFYLSTDGDSSLIEIPENKEEYQQLLKTVFKDCQDLMPNVQYVRLKPTSLARFSQDYEVCSRRPYPRFRYGVIAGLNATRLSAISQSGMFSRMDLNSSIDFSVGAFLDIPINYSGLMFHPEIQFKNLSYQEALTDAGVDYDLVVNYSFVSLPLLIRYSFLKEKMSPFFEAGAVFSTAINNDGTAFTYRNNGNVTTIETNNNPVLQDQLGGFTLGVGLISNYNTRYALSGSLRYTGYYNLGNETTLCQMNEFSLSVGLFF